jgi:ABC-type transporter Mla MlaB component
MIRVTKTEEQLQSIITIDGDLSGEHVAVVETCCSQAGSDGKRVQLHLRDVTTVDQAGRTLLSRLAERGIRLTGSGVYTSYLVQAVTSAKEHNGSPSPSPKRRADLDKRPLK